MANDRDKQHFSATILIIFLHLFLWYQGFYAKSHTKFGKA